MANKGPFKSNQTDTFSSSAISIGFVLLTTKYIYKSWLLGGSKRFHFMTHLLEICEWRIRPCSKKWIDTFHHFQLLYFDSSVQTPTTRCVPAVLPSLVAHLDKNAAHIP